MKTESYHALALTASPLSENIEGNSQQSRISVQKEQISASPDAQRNHCLRPETYPSRCLTLEVAKDVAIAHTLVHDCATVQEYACIGANWCTP